MELKQTRLLSALLWPYKNNSNVPLLNVIKNIFSITLFASFCSLDVADCVESSSIFAVPPAIKGMRYFQMLFFFKMKLWSYINLFKFVPS